MSRRAKTRFHCSNQNQRSQFFSSNHETKFCRPFSSKSSELFKRTSLENRLRSPSSLKFVRATSMSVSLLSSKLLARRRKIAGTDFHRETGSLISLSIAIPNRRRETSSLMKHTAIYQRASIAKRCLLNWISTCQLILWSLPSVKNLSLTLLDRPINKIKLSRPSRTQMDSLCSPECQFLRH